MLVIAGLDPAMHAGSIHNHRWQYHSGLDALARHART